MIYLHLAPLCILLLPPAGQKSPPFPGFMQFKDVSIQRERLLYLFLKVFWEDFSPEAFPPDNQVKQQLHFPRA